MNFEVNTSGRTLSPRQANARVAPHPRRSLSTFVGMWRCDGLRQWFARLCVVIAARGAGWLHCAWDNEMENSARS